MSILNPENWSETDKDANKRRWDYWRALHRVRQELLSKLTGNDVFDFVALFEKHVTDTYGIILKKDSDGNYTDDFDIVDEAKYTFFVLKYTQ